MSRSAMDKFAYLDCNATAPVRPEVARAVAAALAETGNPSSVHAAGRAARQRVEAARMKVAALVGAEPEQVVLTSGGTEANNMALRGGRRAVLAAATEHDSVLNAAPERQRVPVDANGIVDLDALDRMLAAERPPAVVAVMLANNETGAIQPVAEVARAARARGALVLCDAAQAAGRVPVDMAALGADMLTLSAHKLGGPQGVGALVVADHVLLAPLLAGGGQERGRRAGTENVPAIAGFGVAAELAATGLAEAARLAAWRDRIEAELARATPSAVVYGAGAPRLPNTSCLGMPGVPAETQVMAFDLAGVGVSAGAACSSGKVRPSHVLAAMGVPAARAREAIRVSLGWSTTAAEVEKFIAAWKEIGARLGRLSAAA